MKILIGMVEFVLEFGKESNRCNYEQAYDKISSYANFLKQPLELWMFVPCDEDGNVLEEPILSVVFWEKGEISKELQEYQQSKERCLFDGFLISAISNEQTKVIFNNDGCQIRFGLITTISLFKVETIEEMIIHTKSNIELTPTAIKQLLL